MSEEYLNYNYKMPVNKGKTKMKNIHIIPTDKPSRLFKVSGELKLTRNFDFYNGSEYQNIYITNDEEIKEEDWLFANQGANKIVEIKEGNYPYGSINNKGDMIFNSKHWKSKIILTTDQDLVKDGVQAIDDEFLEWFVNNPSCESVEVEKQMLCDYCGQEHCDNLRCRGYKDSVWYEIIIPREEPLSSKLKNVLDNMSQEDFDKEWKKVTDLKMEGPSIFEESKQESLEEAADRLIELNRQDAFHEGAKWQAERMYSEEEVLKILCDFIYDINIDIDEINEIKEWFEQFKKK